LEEEFKRVQTRMDMHNDLTDKLSRREKAVYVKITELLADKRVLDKKLANEIVDIAVDFDEGTPVLDKIIGLF